MGDRTEIKSDTLTAVIDSLGAELVSLRDAAGRELMTDADPAFWTRHAPLLFPIVGRLHGDRYRLDGKEYPLSQHGFARNQSFVLVEATPASAHFRLTATEATRAVYPFEFALDMNFTLDGATLAMEARVTNCGEAPMPASFGYHPAFAWPLPYGRPRGDHRIVFEKDEPGDLSALVRGGWIAHDRWPSPVDGRVLTLNDALFERDALVWEGLNSRSLRYDGGDGPGLAIAFPETDTLGIWTMPGAHYVCVEPWHGIADPAGFDGDFWDKPGILRFDPGQSRTFAMSVTLRD